jgi:hypothetical protein
MSEVVSRALRSYFKKEGHQAAQPTVRGTHQQEVADKSYVVLRNGSGVLAVFRIRTNGVLKRLRRWPTELEDNRRMR